MTAKDMFNKNETLRNWWTSVTDHPNWSMVLLYARGHLAETTSEKAHVEGAQHLEHILTDLGQGVDVGRDVLTIAKPGLRHPEARVVQPVPPLPAPRPVAAPTTTSSSGIDLMKL